MERTGKGCAPTRYREVVLTVSNSGVLLGDSLNHLAVAGGWAAFPGY
jgi:hypothetical protein